MFFKILETFKHSRAAARGWWDAGATLWMWNDAMTKFADCPKSIQKQFHCAHVIVFSSSHFDWISAYLYDMCVYCVVDDECHGKPNIVVTGSGEKKETCLYYNASDALPFRVIVGNSYPGRGITGHWSFTCCFPPAKTTFHNAQWGRGPCQKKQCM